jgi:hypothetical protein
MQERRRAARHKTLLAGKITYGANRFVADCAVRDLSADGARLTLPDALGLPDAFKLDIPQRGQSCQCEIRWRKRGQVGVLFRAVAIKPPQARFAEAG